MGLNRKQNLFDRKRKSMNNFSLREVPEIFPRNLTFFLHYSGSIGNKMRLIKNFNIKRQH